jgi:hypothetical protein
VSFGRAKAVRAPLEEDMGGWSIRGREAGRLVRRAGRIKIGIRRAGQRSQRF